MKRVLVVGKGSYIGSSFARYAKGRFDITAAGSRNGEWRGVDFSGFDSVVFAAGAAHRKRAGADRDLYFAVNRDLAIEVAGKAKAAGVGQVVYLSSLYAYGVRSGGIGEKTLPAPARNDPYGTSKLEAEALLAPMAADRFQVAIVRPPMVYGPDCKGNFPLLVKIAKKAPFIPTIRNRRSMIYIDNLAEFLSIVIERGLGGVFCPQNREVVCTADLLERLQAALGKKPRRMPLMNIPIRMLTPLSPAFGSAFGDLFYTRELSKAPFEEEYWVVGFEESVRNCVLGKEIEAGRRQFD